MTEAVDGFMREFGDVTDESVQSAIRYLLIARIGAAQENKEPGFERIETKMDETWNIATKFQEDLAEKNPTLAFKLAQTLCLLPRSNDVKKENIYKWLRSDGPLLLANEHVEKPFTEYLKSDPKAPDFIHALKGFIEFDMSTIKDQDAAFHESNCFLALVTMLLGTRLKQDAVTAPLIEAVKKRLIDPDISRIVRYYYNSPDTAWIPAELEPHLTK